MILVEPEYMENFSCMADECPDTCCAGWDIIFDEATCSRYRESQDEVLRKAFHQNVIRNEEAAADGSIPFARVKLSEARRCPYLRPDDLCTIQRRTEERNLSETCRTHPRVIQFWGDDYAEVSLQLSCPMAANLVLADRPLDFSSHPIDVAAFKGLRYRQASSQQGMQFRNFLIHILQRREYGIQARLLLANHFFWQAVSLSDDTKPAFLAIVDEMLATLSDKEKVAALCEAVQRHPALDLEILRSLLLHRVQTVSDEATTGLTRWLLDRWKIGVQITPEVLSLFERDRVAAVPFFQRYAQHIENYLVNQVFKAGNPFLEAHGTEKWIQLIFQYALQQFLVTAEIARSAGPYPVDSARQLVQKVTKIVEHDAGYLQQCVKFIHMLQSDNETGMAMLITET